MAIISVGIGHDPSPVIAVNQALQDTPNPNLLICFFGYNLDANAVYAAVRNEVGSQVAIIGGSAWGELSSRMKEPKEGSVVVMSLQSAYLSVGVGVGECLSDNPFNAAQDAVRMAYSNLISNPAVMSLMAIAMDSKGAKEVSRIKPCINMLLPDGASVQEEEFLRGVLTETGAVSPIVGGSTANDSSAATSFQFCNGVFQDSAVVASFSSGLKMGTAMGHAYVPANKGAVVSHAIGRRVFKLNGKPAAEVLAKLLGSEELTPDLFIRHPFGIKSSDVFGEYTIKSAQKVNNDGSVDFYAEIPQGAFLREMKTDLQIARDNFKATLTQACTDAGNPKKVAAIIVFNCILRHHLKCRMSLDDLEIIRDVVGDVPVIGFNTFGEQGATKGGSIGHYNQTATILVIGDEVITQ